MQAIQQEPFPSTLRLFRIWSSIGLQSFGGGASTLLLIRRAFVERHHWVAPEELVHYWNLCLFTPGINLVALTVLIGRKLGGAAGIAVSLLGMLLPSATITCLLTAGFEIIQRFPAIQAILRGVVPATAGIMLLVGLGFAEPIFKRTLKEGTPAVLISLIFVTACFAGLVVLKLSVIVILLAVALAGVICFTPWRGRKELASEKEEQI